MSAPSSLVYLLTNALARGRANFDIEEGDPKGPPQAGRCSNSSSRSRYSFWDGRVPRWRETLWGLRPSAAKDRPYLLGKGNRWSGTPLKSG